MLYNISLLLIYFIHSSLYLLIPFPYLPLPSPRWTWNWFELSLEFWIIFPPYFLPPASLLTISPTHQVGVSFPKTALRTSTNCQQRGGNPKFSVWMVGPSMCLLHSPFQSHSLLHLGIMLQTSFSLETQISPSLHDQIKYHLSHNSALKFPCLFWAFWIWCLSLKFLSGMVTALPGWFLPLVQRLRFWEFGEFYCALNLEGYQ